MNLRMTGAAAFAIATSLTFAIPANAEKMTMKLNMDSAHEVPPNDSAAKGIADVTYDTDSKVLSWKVTYSDLTGAATMAHFHAPAEAGKNAPPVVPFKDVTSGAEGTATLTDAQAADLLAGKMYVNVHTPAHPGGEIRAQVVK